MVEKHCIGNAKKSSSLLLFYVLQCYWHVFSEYNLLSLLCKEFLGVLHKYASSHRSQSRQLSELIYIPSSKQQSLVFLESVASHTSLLCMHPPFRGAVCRSRAPPALAGASSLRSSQFLCLLFSRPVWQWQWFGDGLGTRPAPWLLLL